MKNTELTPAVKTIIKNNWKSKKRTSSELIVYLLLTKNNSVIEKSFKSSKSKTSYEKLSLVNALLNINIENILNDLLYNSDLTKNEVRAINDYMKYCVTYLLLSHLGKINMNPIYRISRLNFKNHWVKYAKAKRTNNVSFLIFTLLNKDNILESLKKAFPAVINKNKEYCYNYNQNMKHAGLMKTTNECRTLPSLYYRLLGYNLQKSVLMKVIPNLYSTLIYEEKK